MEAALHDHLERLKLLCQTQDYPCKTSADICASACEGGSLRCLQYLHREGYCLDALCCLAAASADNLFCMQYAFSEGCPWSGHVMFAASEYSSFSCLCFAYENGCPWWTLDNFEPLTVGSAQCLLFIERYCPLPAISVLSASPYRRLQSLQSKRAASIWCMLVHSVPVALQHIILQYADLLCAASCSDKKC